jgi:hypothetical protein
LAKESGTVGQSLQAPTRETNLIDGIGMDCDVLLPSMMVLIMHSLTDSLSTTSHLVPHPSDRPLIKHRHNGFLFFERRRCTLPRWQKDRRRIVRRYFRGHQPPEQSTSGHQIRMFGRPSRETSIDISQEPRKSDAPQLRDEYRTYKILVGCRESSATAILRRLTLAAGIPNVYYFGQEGLHNILVIDLLGPSLEDLFDHCNRRFSIKTVVMVAKQMVGSLVLIGLL